MSAFFGELYLRSTRPFLAPERTAREVAFLARAFAGARGPLLDVGCGHGRHAAPLARQGFQVVGLELDPLSLLEREPGFPAVRADFFAPPFRAAFAGAYAWYSTLFTGSDEDNAAALKAVAGCLRPKARCVLHSVPVEWMAQNPRAAFHGALPDGSRLDEENTFHSDTGRDEGVRRLHTADGRTLEARYSIRYYTVEELARMGEGAGLALSHACGDLDGGPLARLSKDLVVTFARIA